MSEYVYKIYDKKSGKYCSSGLVTRSAGGKKFWTKKGHARSAIACQLRDKDDPRWDQYEIHEYELVRGMSIPSRDKDAEPTLAEQLDAI